MGRGFPRLSIISSALLVLLCFFYVYSISAYLALRVYPLIDRVTYYAPFDVYITNAFVDHFIIGVLLILWLVFAIRISKTSWIAIGAVIAFFTINMAIRHDIVLADIAIASLPLILSIQIYDRYSDKKILNTQSLKLMVNYSTILGIVIGIIGIALALIPVALGVSPKLIIRNYAYDLFLIFSSTSPILALLLVTCIPVKFLMDFIMKSLKNKYPLNQKETRKKNKKIYLLLIVLLSIALVIIPHIPTINPDSQQVGVDTRYYVTWITNLDESKNAQEFIHQAFIEQNKGDRPLSLIFLYMLHRSLSVTLFDIIEYVPIILSPALAITTYFFVRELTSNDIASILASFLTAVSFQTLIGIYAGFYANWLALIFGYLSLLFLFRFLKSSGNRNLLLYGLLIIMTLFTHVYTWSIFAIVIGAFLVVMLLKNSYHNNRRKTVLLLLMVLLMTVAIDAARALSANSSGGIERDLEIAESLAGPEQFALRWNNLSYALFTFVGGQFANFIILGLGLYWLIRAGIRDVSTIFLMIFLSVGLLPFLFGEWQIQSRVFYNIPFQIPAALALWHIRKYGNLGVVSAICVWLIAVAIISVTNFYLISPPS